MRENLLRICGNQILSCGGYAHLHAYDMVLLPVTPGTGVPGGYGPVFDHAFKKSGIAEAPAVSAPCFDLADSVCVDYYFTKRYPSYARIVRHRQEQG